MKTDDLVLKSLTTNETNIFLLSAYIPNHPEYKNNK